MEWTKTPPTKHGWYWVITNDLGWKNAPECVFVGYPDYDDRLHVYEISPLHYSLTLEEYCKKYMRHWFGPIEKPEYPKGD